MKKLTFILIVAALSLVLSFAATAQDLSPKIFILSPTIGTPIRSSSSFYDSSDDTILVSGIFADVSQALLDMGVAISVNGSLAPADFSFTGNRTVNGVVYHSGTFSQKATVISNDLWPGRPFVAEIVNLKTLEAEARHHISLYDLRTQESANPNEPLTTELTAGMSIQLTDRGVGYHAASDSELNLERTERALLPVPTLTAFNDLLSTNARTIPDKSEGPGLRLCEDYKNLDEPKLKDEKKFEAYKKAFKSANTQFKKYKAAKALCNLGATPALVASCKLLVEANFCVKSKPKANDFKLCVDRIDGDVQRLEIEGVSYQGLNFEEANAGTRGRIRSHISASNLTSKINGLLRGMTVEWKNSLCLDVTAEPVEESYIERTRWLKDWSTCKNIIVRDGSASTLLGDNAGRYQIRADPSDSELPKASLVEAGLFSYSNPSTNANKGMCKEAFLNPSAASLGDSYRFDLRTKFQNTWYAENPEAMEASALTSLLAPYKLGTYEKNKYDIFASLATLASAPLTGFITHYTTTVTTTDPVVLNNQRNRWFFSPPTAVPFSSDGRDHLGRLFDISYNVTTGMLNRILNMRVATPQGLNIVYKPTWEDMAAFGVVRPAGAAVTDRAILDRKALIRFDPAFLNIGNKKLQIEVRPVLDPIVYMPADPTVANSIPNVGVRTVYGADTLEISFKEKDRVVNGDVVAGKTWLKLRGGFVDLGFNFSISNKGKAYYLKPNLAADVWAFNISESPKILCDLNFSGPVAPVNPCEGRIEGKVARLMKTGLRPIFIELLSKVPAPQYFDGDGKAKKKDFYFTQVTRRQESQNITFYGIFD